MKVIMKAKMFLEWIPITRFDVIEEKSRVVI